jgi:uncharacterized protein (TIGR00297 family)
MKPLTRSGTIAAAAVGTACAVAGLSWLALLLSFFISGTVLTRFRANEKERLTGGINAKSGARDAAQVFANGGVFALAAIGSAVYPSPLWMIAGASAIAASAADTWATEIGTLSRSAPRSIVTLRRVRPGASGGISMMGLAAGIAGAASMAAIAALAQWPAAASQGAFVGGLAGSIVDSLLGATVQAMRWCAACGMETEREIHSCGSPAARTRGLSWMSNDLVNLLGSVAGALAGVLLFG